MKKRENKHEFLPPPLTIPTPLYLLSLPLPTRDCLFVLNLHAEAYLNLSSFITPLVCEEEGKGG